MGTKRLGLARDCRSRVVTVEGLLARFVNFYDQPIEQLAEPRNHESMRFYTL